MRNFTLVFLISAVCSFAKAEQAAASLPENPFAEFFEKAYQLHPSIPQGVLEAVAFTNTRFSHLTDGQPASCTGIPRTYGVMGLTADGKNYFRNNLSLISHLSGYSAEEIISSCEKNIMAFARAYAIIYDDTRNKLMRAPAIFDHAYVLAYLSELPLPQSGMQNDFALNSYLYSVLSFLKDPAQAAKHEFQVHDIDLESFFGEKNLKVLSASRVIVSSGTIADKQGNNFQGSDLPAIYSPDYGPALYDPAASCNYSNGRNQAISAVTIHTVQGNYAGCISWFKNCAASVSAHYVVRSSDGQVTQMVLEANTAWHVGSQNGYTIGIEHEGFVDNPAWYTTAMYAESAKLCADICASQGISPLRTGFQPWMPAANYNAANIPGTCVKIKGHQHYPGQSHTDPGPNWNWDYLYRLINTQPAPTVLTSASGTISDSGGAGGNYSDDERTVWTISPTAAANVTLTFNSFNTENTWDYLYIYNGTDVWAPLIGYYTGTSSPGTIVANSGAMTLEFRSDCATPAAGWSASWTSNATIIIPTNLAVAGFGCPSLGVNLNWQNSGANWVVDVSDDPNYSYFWAKGVTNLTTVGCPGSFALNTNPNNFLAFQPGTVYYWRIWDGTSHTSGSPFTTPNCVYMDTTCSGTFDDTGGPSAAYTGNEDWTNIIQPGFASSVTINFSSFDLETNFDSLWIYDSLPGTNLIGIYTGTVSPGTKTANSGMMSLRFKADPFVNNAGWTASWTCVSTTGIGQQQLAAAVAVYPNPFSESAVLAIESSAKTEGIGIVLIIYDLYGRKVKEQLVVGSRTTIVREDMANGMYFYRVKNREEVMGSGKLVIK